jgi:hypothetical protein
VEGYRVREEGGKVRMEVRGDRGEREGGGGKVRGKRAL